MDNFIISPLLFEAEFDIMGYAMTEKLTVYQAELERVKGPTRELIEKLRNEARVPLETIAKLEPEKLVDLMRFWRIWTVTLMSLYRKTWNGKRAAQFLLEVRGVMINYYNHPIVAEAAREMKTDPEGHEYQMFAEMCRDKGKFFLRLAELTGSFPFLATAQAYFGEAIRASESSSSARAVATMEEKIAKRQLGTPINWLDFAYAYRDIVNSAPQAGGWDRLAATSWLFIREALLARESLHLKQGLENLKKATQEMGVDWVMRYPLGDVISSVAGLSRRVTAGKINLEQFRL